MTEERVNSPQEFTYNQPNKCQAADAQVHPMDSLEHYWIRPQQGIHESVDERHIQRHQEHNRLGEEHAERSTEIDRDQFIQVEFNLVLFSMNTPVPGLSTQGGCLFHQHDGGIGLPKEE